MKASFEKGFTLVEVLLAVVIGSLLLAGLANISRSALSLSNEISAQSQLDQQAQATLQLMADSLRNSTQLLIPQQDLFNNSDRDFRRHGVNGAVLGFRISPKRDFNDDNIVDADQDGDGVVDEDPGADTNNDFAAGIWLIDDDGDGLVDEGSFLDDDEDGQINEDPINGADDDNDGLIDEDPSGDLNGDGKPGIENVDDDNDGFVDEGFFIDSDQENGLPNHDWFDTAAFYIEPPSTLTLRTPVPWDENNTGLVNGRDTVTESLVANVAALEFERFPRESRRSDLVRMLLTLEDDEGRTATVETTVQVGGAL